MARLGLVAAIVALAFVLAPSALAPFSLAQQAPSRVDMTACPTELHLKPGETGNVSVEVHNAGAEKLLLVPTGALRPGIDDDGNESVGLVSVWKLRAEQSKLEGEPGKYVPGRFKLTAPSETDAPTAADHVDVVLGLVNGSLAPDAAPLVVRVHLGEGGPVTTCTASAFIVTPPAPIREPVPFNAALVVGLALGGGALALGVASVSRARRLGQAWWGLGALLPLFTRLVHAKLLDHDTRQRVFAAIQARPGIHFTALRATLALSTGVIDHHTRLLSRAGLIHSRREGRYRAYYVSGVHVPIVQAAPLGDTAARLLAIVRDRGEMTYADLMASLGLSKAGVSHHVHALQARGLVALVRLDDGRWVVRATTRAVQSSS